ncbi:MAG: DegT/DnrJ/EryC1/StrS family aminotransferase [Nocardioidaceae bacterium]|nr:DegT/DnrJ/EryC1/StrS family aminotransferase [Nocardioidaceae bacterium]
MKRVPIAGPSITAKEIAYVQDAVANAWYDGAGAPVVRFEEAFATYLGRRHAVSLPSCTSGLHLALRALGIGPGDEVIVPDLTWIASSAPIAYVGATPVFADVDPDSLCATPESVRACLTPRTKAVIVVDLYGAMPDMAAIEAVTREAGVALIEDAAEAIGSSLDGRPAGTYGAFSAFSFHGSKTMTTGEGGMLVCDDHTLADRVDQLRDHGRRPGDRAFNNAEVAFKYKMSSLQAALGLAQLERIDELVALKRRLHGWYEDRLGDRSELRIYASPNPGVVWWMVTAQVDPEIGLDKDELQDRLAAVGIDTRPLFRPLSSLPAYADEPQAALARQRNDVAYRLSPYGLNLPSALSLSEGDVDRVCQELVSILAA